MTPDEHAKYDSLLTEFQKWAPAALDSSQVTTDEEDNFCPIAVALCKAAEQNYKDLQNAYDRQDQVRAAWTCRNLMEIALYMKFVLQSEENANEFAEDRLIDASDAAIALKKVLAELNESDPSLEATIERIKKQMVSEGVTRTTFRSAKFMAKQLNLKVEYENMNRLCSKFVHPTAWSLFEPDQGPDKFPGAEEIFYACGAKYFDMLFAEIQAHVWKFGLHHKPKS
jgi:hypothetical protein